MDESFFRSFWNLLLSQVRDMENCDQDKLLTDLFSTTFFKASELVSEESRMEFAESLQKSVEISPLSRINRACLLVLVGWLRGTLDLFESDFIQAAVDSSSSLDESIELLGSGPVGKVVQNLITPEGRLGLIRSIETTIVPQLASQDDKSRFLAACQFVASDIESILSDSTEIIAAWCRQGPSANPDEIIPILSRIIDSPRVVSLFRQLPGVALLKERFLVTLAMGLRSAGSSELVEQTKKAFFFVPSVGIVMDRWLDKEIQKFNADVLNRVSGGKEALKTALSSAFLAGEEWAPIPFGFEEPILSYIRTYANPESNFKELPCALTRETVCLILRQFGHWFEIVSDTKARLTPAALGGQNKPVVGPPVSAEDLVDVLLKEILNKLPDSVFANRPYPTKVQTGVYRFGNREVTFHTRAGKLFVFRVGGYISESDALEFVAREYSVPIDKLKAQRVDSLVPSASSVPVKSASSGTAGMRRPMEWDNTKLLIRLVRRGLRARDPIWRQGWESMDFRGPPRGAPKEVLQKFLEQNMAHAVRQSWARDLLYFEDKKAELGESSDIDSDHQAPTARPTGMTHQQPPETHPNYKTRLCVNFPMGRCTRGATCAYAHGEAELRAGAGGTVAPAQPSQHQFYKTRLCQAFMEGRCTRGVACNYAHSEDERQAFAGQGVVKRDIRASEDIRLAAKAEIQSRGRSRSRDRYRRS